MNPPANLSPGFKISHFSFIVFLCFSLASGDSPIRIDGIANKAEWEKATTVNLSAGGVLRLLREGNELFGCIEAPKKSWVHVYLGTRNSVRVLHMSAALGETTYSRSGDLWRTGGGFQWSLRDKLFTDSLAIKQQEYYREHGWVGNNNNMGNGQVFEFKLNLESYADATLACVVAGIPFDLSTYPGNLSDQTIFPELVRGYTPDSLRFAPASWSSTKL